MTTDEMMRIIEADPYANVTFTGGDPMYQPEGFAELAQAIHARTDKDIWCYTGFTFEQLLNNPALRDDDLIFRGSSNQRIIDVPRSLQEGHVVLLPLNNNLNYPLR